MRRIGRVNAFYGIVLAGSALVALGVPASASAQQKQKVSFSVPAESTKYTQQHMIDVGDVPGHQVRVFEILRSYGKNAPQIDGQRLKESWTRGMSDYTEFNGSGYIYSTFVTESGEKIYARGTTTAQAAATGGSKSAMKVLAVQTITGGTGRFAAIRGIVRIENVSDIVAGTNASNGELEYWMEK